MGWVEQHKQRVYETEKRPDRTFQNKWKEGRDWLVHDEHNNIMQCTTLLVDSFSYSGHDSLNSTYR